MQEIDIQNPISTFDLYDWWKAQKLAKLNENISKKISHYKTIYLTFLETCHQWS